MANNTARNAYLQRVEEHAKLNGAPIPYYCPHHKQQYYMRRKTLADEKWYMAFTNDAEQFAAIIARLLCDENGNRMLNDGDYVQVMTQAGFIEHAQDMIKATGLNKPIALERQEGIEQKKEQSSNPRKPD